MKEMRGRDMELKGKFILILGLIMIVLSGCTVERIHLNESINVTQINSLSQQFNAWNNTLTGVNGLSNIVDTENMPHISIFKQTSGSTTIRVLVSADCVHFTLCDELTTRINTPTGDSSHIFFTAGVRCYQLQSTSNVKINATISAKP